MSSFEEGFSATEKAAESVLTALNEAAAVARRLRKASQDGNIAAVRRESERLEPVVCVDHCQSSNILPQLHWNY